MDRVAWTAYEFLEMTEVGQQQLSTSAAGFAASEGTEETMDNVQGRHGFVKNYIRANSLFNFIFGCRQMQ